MTALDTIELLLAERIGLDVASTGPALIHRAVQTRMQSCQLMDATQYARLVESDEAEWRSLIDLVVVPESWFFRDLRPFLRLQEFVRSEWRPRGSACFRVLSIPCARGEEAFSLAIALLDAGLTREQIIVDAIDVSDAVLRQARSGLYRTNAFRKEMIGNPSHYLTEVGSGFEIRSEVRDLVRFRQGNLLDVTLQTGESEYDAVFCRNVLIYLTPAAKEIAIARLASLIRPGGLLFVGHAEALTILRERFVPDADIASFAYRKPLADPPRISAASGQGTGNKSGDRTRPLRRPPRALLEPRTKGTPPIPSPPQESPGNPATESLRDAKLAQAIQLADRREYVHAARLCQELLAEQGPDARVYFLLGMIELGEGRAVEAEAYLHKVAYLDNNNVEALLALASLARQRGDNESAERHARRARRVEDENRNRS